ncbi:sugar phosphate isomerase/epimerase family protein [Agromyces allii]|uniref:Xylose isomerase-like TIM barrel domain-containing protein n=1 Tax=Agromyces allii TaxID=393607 RepID=A0ABN2Q1A2_9MICO|nr:sugar phosphate isomerase/epimerase [Agromyces allii]
MSHHTHGHPTVSAKPMSRRNLLQALAASSVAVGLGAFAAPTAASALAAPAALPAALPTASGGARLVPVNRIGIQLFTVRDKLSGAGSIGFRRLFEELSAIGYSEVEFAGYTQGGAGAITPAEIRQLLDDNGLRAVGSHTTLNPSNIDAQLAIANTLGMQFLGQGGAIASGRSDAAWVAASQTWNTMGEKAKAAGVKLYTHTHDGEWNWTTNADGSPTTRRPYDVMWDEFDPDLVAFEMDIYWAYVGRHKYPGFEPVEWLKRDPRRFPLVHLKDGKLNGASANGYDIIEFGAGDIPYAQILSELQRNRGQRYGMYEQDNAGSTAAGGNPVNSLGNADRSYDKIAALRG